MSGRILVIRGGALGDFVLGLPALRALREAYPDSNLDLIAPRAVLPLVGVLVDSTIPLELAENAALFDDSSPLERLPDRYRDLDLAVVWLADPEGALRRNFERLGARRVLQSPALPPRDGQVHATDHLLSTLAPLGITGKGRPAGSAGVSPASAARDKATAILHGLDLVHSDRLVAIHPGSGGRWKCWAPNRFARVIGAVVESGARPVLIQGPADEEVVAATLAEIEGSRTPVVADLPVEDLAGFLSLCAAYLGNDSGVTHLAAAVGTPTVALFGPTDPVVWGPRGRYVTVIHGEGGRLEEITVAQVAKAILGT